MAEEGSRFCLPSCQYILFSVALNERLNGDGLVDIEEGLASFLDFKMALILSLSAKLFELLQSTDDVVLGLLKEVHHQIVVNLIGRLGGVIHAIDKMLIELQQ